MNDDDLSDEVYGDTDPNNLSDDGDQGAPAMGQTSAGDGLPGYPVGSDPNWRAGVFGAGDGLLGLIKVSNPVVSGPRPALGEGQAYPMPPAYMPDGHGGVQLRPGFAATHPKGPFDFGAMAHNIDWIGVAKDLATIFAGSVGAAFPGEARAIGMDEVGSEVPASAEEGAKIQDYGGPGGGHHVPAKSAFQGAEGYDPINAPAIPNDELTRLGVDHSLVTGAQQMGYRALSQSGRPLTWETVEQVETNALVRGGMDVGMARATVQKAIKQLRQSGVSAPTRIPWSR